MLHPPPRLEGSGHRNVQREACYHGVRLAIEPSLLTYCHDWSTRHDARRTYYLANGSSIRLAHRHAKPDPSWMPPGWLK